MTFGSTHFADNPGPQILYGWHGACNTVIDITPDVGSFGWIAWIRSGIARVQHLRGIKPGSAFVEGLGPGIVLGDRCSSLRTSFHPTAFDAAFRREPRPLVTGRLAKP